MSRVLFISVHPDDETLGCGGAILKHRLLGDDVFWLIMTNINDEDKWGKVKILERQKEIDSVAGRFGFAEVRKLNFDTMKLDGLPLDDLIQGISQYVRKILPTSIYVNNRSDVHSDHRVGFKATMSATKSFNNPFLQRILMYETLSETEFAPSLGENAFAPNFFVDISKFIAEKIDIMKIYRSELREHPFPRSEKNIRALATFRGAQCGAEYAEGFVILKDIWR